MVIHHNLTAMNADRQLNIVTCTQAKHMEKLSSGYRINRAADDAAGLAISEKMRCLIRGLNKGIENAQDGVSLCQIADSALNEVSDMLHRLEELSVKAANGTNTEADRQMIQEEVDQILSEINRISETSTFNEQRIFSGGTASGTEAAEPSTICGDFTVAGGTLGTDYTFENGVLKIISNKSITISNTNSGVATTNRIEVASGVNANITLAGVNIDVSSIGSAAAFQIADNSTGNVTITLADGTNNVLKSGPTCAGLQKNGDALSGTLTIQGNTGKLTATGGIFGAGIGGGQSGTGSNITISGGSVTATSGGDGAGIGGGRSGTGSNITISGGSVTATGGGYGAGIGGGDVGDASNITISGGSVTATGGRYGAGIGGGQSGTGSNITISGGTVTATGGAYGAGIGGGRSGTGSNITISGGNVTATGGANGAGIGGGYGGAGSYIRVNIACVTAKGGQDASDIGGGQGGISSNITISEGGSGNPSGGGDGDTGNPSGGGSGGNQSSLTSGILKSLKRWWIQCGSESGVGMFVEIESIDTVTLGIHGMDVTTQENADKAISMISGALEKVSSVRSNIGAQQNRLEHTIANESNIVENTTAAESRIRDTDMAGEMLGLTTANILAQAGISVLAQANSSNEAVLALLR